MGQTISDLFATPLKLLWTLAFTGLVGMMVVGDIELRQVCEAVFEASVTTAVVAVIVRAINRD